MAVKTLDTLGLKCPQPILKVVAFIPNMEAGDILEIMANCPSFPTDIKAWCEKTGKTLLFCMDDGTGSFSAQIQF
ncbi:MAG: sulfurtransferase TusA family protein [Candidatus Cloacimonetes bacterium]|jgi:tRNA 2-thiouridine synthesizing protein A|nr:sulfurtransferase TusA family protein [Candidatus Cloacimonadota bacterium]MBT7469230.1 sulfurtransferase TusA family protein [Candidatus Cloacimonadota bacterium]